MSKIWKFVNSILLVALVINLAAGAHCPDNSLIAPCKCSESFLPPSAPPTLNCAETAFTQNDVDNALTVYRNFNGVPDPSQPLDLYKFILDGPYTSPTLDLSRFAQLDFNHLYIYPTGSPAFVGGTNSTDEVDVEPLRFSAQILDAEEGNLTDPSAAELLKFIKPEKLSLLWLSSNDLTMVPTLAPFTQVGSVMLSQNKISKIGGGEFKTLGRIYSLLLDNMQMVEIGQNGLLVERPLAADNETAMVPCDTDSWPYPCDIWLHFNNLTEDRIHEDHGLESWGGPTELKLDSNKIEFLAETKFNKFLMAHPGNKMTMHGNPLVCDERMKWIKDRRDELETRLTGLDCINDPGQTVYTTDLIF